MKRKSREGKYFMRSQPNNFLLCLSVSLLVISHDILSSGSTFAKLSSSWPVKEMEKNAAKRDSAGAVCNSGMGMLF